MKSPIYYLKHPSRMIHYLVDCYLHSSLGERLSDEQYIKVMFRNEMGYKLDLESPKGFNEKLQWLKLNNRNPIHTKMVDKYEVKQYVSERIGDKYVIPLYGVWDSFEDIDFAELPEQFVLKTTHDCGGVVVCQDKEAFDVESAKLFLDKHLRNNYYLHCREWPYKNVKPRIIAEKFVKDGENDFLPVYKFFCFDGKVKMIQSIQNDKQPNESIDYFNSDWNLLELKTNYPNSENPLPKPKKFDEMLRVAETLSKGNSFIRVDLYQINDEIYFSEYTFFSDAGFVRYKPESWDNKLGDWLHLPDRKG